MFHPVCPLVPSTLVIIRVPIHCFWVRYYRFFFLWSLLYWPLSPSILSDLKKSVYIETGEEKERSQTQWLSPKDRKLTWIYPEHDLGKRTSFLPFFFYVCKRNSVRFHRLRTCFGSWYEKKQPISIVGSRPFSIAFPMGLTLCSNIWVSEILSF